MGRPETSPEPFPVAEKSLLGRPEKFLKLGRWGRTVEVTGRRMNALLCRNRPTDVASSSSAMESASRDEVYSSSLCPAT